MRFGKGTLSNEILTRWINQHCPSDLKDKNEVVSVKMIPDKLVLKPGQRHQVQMLATYSDGTVRDVTRLGIFTANNTEYAEVSDEGMVAGGMAGETAIVGRFERTFAATSVMVLNFDGNFTQTPVPQKHLVDKHVVDVHPEHVRELTRGVPRPDRDDAAAQHMGGDVGGERLRRDAKVDGDAPPGAEPGAAHGARQPADEVQQLAA